MLPAEDMKHGRNERAVALVEPMMKMTGTSSLGGPGDAGVKSATPHQPSAVVSMAR